MSFIYFPSPPAVAKEGFLNSRSERYFVKYSEEGTLVPGGLVKSAYRPRGRWRELKREPGVPERAKFHRVVYSTLYTAVNIYSNSEFVQIGQFFDETIFPVWSKLFPDIPYDWALTGSMYYFMGDYAALMEDTSQLQPFVPLGLMWVNTNSAGPPGVNYLTTEMIMDGGGLMTNPGLPIGFYSLIMELTAPAAVAGQYIVMENIFQSLPFVDM